MLHSKLIFTIASVALISLMSGQATAQKRVVVLDVEGARDNKIEGALADIVGESNKVISAKSFARAAKRAKVKRLTPTNVKRVAGRLEADGVLQSILVSDGDGGYLLRLRLREGSSGRTVKKLAMRLASRRLSSKLQRKLSSKLLGYIDDLPFNDSVDEEPPNFDPDLDSEIDDDEAMAPRRAKRRVAKKKAKRKKATKKKRARKKRTARERRVASVDDDVPLDDDDDFDDDDLDDDLDDDEPIDEDEPPDDDEFDADGGEVSARAESGDEPKRSAAERRRRGAMLIEGGVTAINRQLVFQARADLMDNAPQGYTGPMAPAGRVAGELYPLALDPKREGAAANIGIGFEVDRVFGLQTQIDDNGTAINMATNQLRYSAGVRYRHNFGNKATHPTMVLSVGYNRLDFVIDKPENVLVDLPNTSYTYYDPGIAFRIPFGEKVALTANGRAMLITSAGEVQQRDQYGTAKLTGVDAGAGLEFLVGEQYVVRAAGRFIAVGYEFEGDGEQTLMRDGDPNTIDVGGALDRYISGSVTAGYLF